VIEGTKAGTKITVRASGSTDPSLGLVAEAFQKATGHPVVVTYDDQIAQDYRGSYDVVVASRDVVEREFRHSGSVDNGGISIGRMGLGIAVRKDGPLPEISSLEALRTSIFDADTILVTTHTSGLYFAAMLKKMEIYGRVENKIKSFANGPVLMTRLANGSGSEFGILSLNQVHRFEHKGVVLVGPLPDDIQYYREFIAVPMTASVNKDIAWDFVRFCGGAGKPLFAASGFN
jgi:molybdate transport system substrate-binding protein